VTLTIYGSPRSRTLRVLWAAQELGLHYDHVPLEADDPALKQADYRTINPAGVIPAIVDDGLALSESLAINLYLAKKRGSHGAEPLYPPGPEAEAEIWRWTLWAQAHLEPWVQQDARLTDLRAAISPLVGPALAPALALLDRTLAKRSWLTAGHFTIADLNVASVLSPSRVRLIDMSSATHVAVWLDRCYARTAAVATRERFGV
jgi:glutathione S-transferase